VNARSVALFGAVALLAHTACDDEEEMAPPPPPTKKVTAVSNTPATAGDAHLQHHGYSPIGKRDPFTSYLVQLQDAGKEKPQRKLEATEQFELDQYKLTGLVTGTSQPKAMLEDPNSKGHVVHIGSRLGKNAGVVTRITTEAMVVTEEFRTPTGDKVRVPITIKLPQPELELLTEQ
jgi:type IV pilus assembly protein PilP